ncbi:SDR family NAD(P)-dependent oxidoreductase [Aeromicrobium senzhongii]|uniref:SDR family NAD(P)-dependent oxidoreductase n=1 Tax=Aeromicrobium senzhongii TaxID=2663859 RepID=A0ABX6SSE7_9ACTN|nr:SDR family oxidoreductase [Aeromicrobium senzhongii]MTB89553.1 SDR family NAD(P)-dependent oxidoreductase [Aeromicrobium senzhongii]QNL94319.1 SDR family NAD(P)-dependent oxidoreductase [Aeromicrobium senzhongii]
MSTSDRQVVIITGAGRGLGRAHALEFAERGAAVVVNDLGASLDGTGAEQGPAEEVAEQVRARGGDVLVNGDDISEPEGAERLLAATLDAFGRVDVLVNNAGILRDRTLINMTIEEWDAVIKVHLRGTFAPMKAVATHWRELSRAGEPVDGRIINTTSSSGIYGNPGQSNYGAAKAGIAAMTIIASRELARYGITVNAIAPAALTRMTEGLRTDRPEIAEGEFNPGAPENVSPLVAWLASPAAKDVTGRVFNVRGGHVSVAEGWIAGPSVEEQRRLTVEDLDTILPDLLAQARPNALMNGKVPQEVPA